MDPTALIPLLTGGGPTALIVVLALVIWYQSRAITTIKGDVQRLQTELHQIQICQAQDAGSRSDLVAQIAEIKTMLREFRQEIHGTTGRIFERIEEQNSRCGRDCLASLIAKERVQR